MTAHPIDTEALRRLADAATPGPWKYHEAGSTIYSPAVNEHDRFDALSTDIARIEETDADAEFIAAARTAVPALLDALAAAEHRATRAEAQSAIRKKQVAYWRAETQKTRDRLRALSTEL